MMDAGKRERPDRSEASQDEERGSRRELELPEEIVHSHTVLVH